MSNKDKTGLFDGDNLLNQIVNISKASAYDIVCKQRDELLAKIEVLEGKAADLTENAPDANNPTYQFLSDENGELKEQMAQSLRIYDCQNNTVIKLQQRNEKLLEALGNVGSLLDFAINATATGAVRNLLTDANILAKAALSDNTPIQETGGFAE